MISNVILNSVVLAPIFLILAAAIKYDFLFQDEELFSRCEYADVKFIDDYVDMSNMSFEFITSESIYVHGEVVSKKDIGTKFNPVSVEVYKRSRGTWVYTVYSLRYPDACQAVFNPTGMLDRYTKDIEDKTCPFYKGQKFYLNTTADMTLDLSNPRLAGEYKFQVMITITELNEVLCYNIFADAYRH